MYLTSANRYNIFYARLVNVQGDSASNAMYKKNNNNMYTIISVGTRLK